MNCVRCNGTLLINGYCNQCGLKDTFIAKCMHTSNYYYNLALDKALVRDLSGAVIDLKKALRYNKRNIDARNLLGLCYHEMGEVVSALSEWIVSVNLQEEDNIAAHYIEVIQEDSKRLDDVNATIRKYNQSLQLLKRGDFDLALIQLKKVLDMTPNYVNGHLLLALLYIQSGNREKAKKEIRKVLRIDVNNTLALKYYHEVAGAAGLSRHVEPKNKQEAKLIEKETKRLEAEEQRNRRVELFSGSQLSIDQYVESSSNIHVFVGLVVGLIIGIATMYFLFIPQKTDELASSYNSLKKEYNEEVSGKNKEIQNLKDNETSLQKSVDELTKQLALATGENGEGNVLENVINAAKCVIDGDEEKAAQYLIKTNINDVDSNDAKKLYNQLSDTVLPAVSKRNYEKGYSNMNSGNYEDAVKYLTKAIEYDDTNVDALFYLGRTYQHMTKYDSAKKTYQEGVDKFADSRRASQAKDNIAMIGG